MAWTTADLLTSIRNRQMFPEASTGSLSAAALLQYGTEELLITILPMIMSLREKYYETYLDTDYTASIASLALPSRSIGNLLASLQYIYGQQVYNVESIEPHQISSTAPTATPYYYYFENNDVVFYPPPSGTSGTIRQRYYQRPSRLAETSDCAQITAFDSGTGVATCVPPSTWATTDTFDFIPQTASQSTPFGLDSSISAISSSDITFTGLSTTDAAKITAGDWIALAGYTPIPEVPFELQALLSQAVCVRALGAINDATGLSNAKPDLATYIQAAITLLTPRDKHGAKVVSSDWRIL